MQSINNRIKALEKENLINKISIQITKGIDSLCGLSTEFKADYIKNELERFSFELNDINNR